MNDKKDDGGPAFPVLTNGRDAWGKPIMDLRAPGMSLRDWFAGQTIATMAFANSPSMAAELAYKLADEMIRARIKP